MYNQQEVA
jgi:hypothetical protein